jgi:hypothetical protein
MDNQYKCRKTGNLQNFICKDCPNDLILDRGITFGGCYRMLPTNEAIKFLILSIICALIWSSPILFLIFKQLSK